MSRGRPGRRPGTRLGPLVQELLVDPGFEFQPWPKTINGSGPVSRRLEDLRLEVRVANPPRHRAEASVDSVDERQGLIGHRIGRLGRAVVVVVVDDGTATAL